MSVDHMALIANDFNLSESSSVSESEYELLQRFAALVASSDDAIISQTIEGVVTSWNGGAERIFGYSAPEMVGQPIFRIACVGGKDDMIGVLDRIRQGERVDHYETIRRCKDGREIPVSLTVSPIRNASGMIVGASKIARDISRQKQTERAIRITEKLAAVGRLASSIAHDINNPLAALTNLLFLLGNESLSEGGRRHLADAQRELTRVSHIASQALGFYRSSGDPVWTSISAILDDSLALLQDRWQTLEIEVSRNYDSTPQLCCHPGELRQVMVNLIGNALDAMPSGGRLRLKVRGATDAVTGRRGVRVTVADTGTGMSGETRLRLFEPFYTTKETTGSGLGLWVCADIVNKYEGRISMRASAAPSRSGSVFVLFLPL